MITYAATIQFLLINRPVLSIRGIIRGIRVQIPSKKPHLCWTVQIHASDLLSILSSLCNCFLTALRMVWALFLVFGRIIHLDNLIPSTTALYYVRTICIRQLSYIQVFGALMHL